MSRQRYNREILMLDKIYSSHLNFWLRCRSARNAHVLFIHSACSRLRSLAKNPIALSMVFVFLVSFVSLTVFASTKPVLPIQHWQTKNGARVYFVESKQLPMVDIEVVFNAGSARDGSQFGIAQLTNGMLNEGTKTLNADQIAKNFEQVGAQYGADVDRDKAAVTLRSLVDPKFLNPALETFADILSNTNFPQNSFQRVQKQTLTAIQREKQSPSVIARNDFDKNLYFNQPYGHSVLGTQATVETLKAQDLQKFYRQYYVANNATIAIVGDVSRQKAEAIAEQITKTLPSGSAASLLPQPKPLTKADTQKINYPSQQTTVLIGQIGIAKKDPDFFPLLVGNHILGGGVLTSRLFEEVRNKRGLSYGVSSQFSTAQIPGPFMIVLQTRNDQVKNAVEATRQTLQEFLNNGPTEKELKQAKQNIIGGFPLAIADNASILGNLVNIGFYQMPLDYLDTFRDKVNAVTLDQVRVAFKKHIQPDKMVTVMVGE